MPLVHFGYFILALAVFTQLVFLMYYFNRFARHKSKRISPEYPIFLPVSVLIVVKNEKANLKELLPLLLKQDYPSFEIFIMDDHSSDGTAEWIKDFAGANPQIRYGLYDREPMGKKQSLAAALPLLAYDLVMMTDADCRPASDLWIKQMAVAMGPGESAVLGYSPYLEKAGWLNALIRLETAYTAILYFSSALRHHPYMGVGRNLLYKKQSLIRNFRPDSHPSTLSGDDDLTINALGRKEKVGIAYLPGSWMYSIPKSSWREWINQKKRHVSTAVFYKYSDQIRLMLFYGSFVVSWVLGLGLGFTEPRVWLAWLMIKLLLFMGFIKPCLVKLGLSFSFMHWLRAEAVYVLGLVWLFPFSTIKKWDKW